MNGQTLVAVYDTAAHADAAVRDLKAANVPADAISQHAKNGSMSGTATAPRAREQGFWARLFGEPDEDTTVYDRSIDSGATVVTVRAAGDHVDRVTTILEKHNPVDLDERAARFSSTDTTTTRTTTAPATAARGTSAARNGDDSTMQLAEEQLSVGKRAVGGGTTRIRRFTVSTPVEKQVSLRSEKVTLDRRPVTDGRPIADGNFADKTIEMTETNEEAVVSKTARVKEEVSLRKEASDRTETVKDNVRRDEVDVEQIPGRQTEVRRAEGMAPVKPAVPAQRSSKI